MNLRKLGDKNVELAGISLGFSKKERWSHSFLLLAIKRRQKCNKIYEPPSISCLRLLCAGLSLSQMPNSAFLNSNPLMVLASLLFL